MKYCVTGAAGFIGSHLCDLLLQEGHEVIGLDNLYSGRESNLHNCVSNKNFTFIKEDILNTKSLTSHFHRCDAIFHLAGIADIVPSIDNPVMYHEVNVNGTLSVLEAMKQSKVNKIIYAASSSCYGIPKEYPTSEQADIDPRYPYALTKYIGEQYIIHWSKVYKLEAISLRLFNVYGPRSRTNGSYGAVLGTFLAQKIANKPFTIVGDGTQTRDFIHVLDVAKAFLMAASLQSFGEIYNIGASQPRSIKELTQLLQHPQIEYIPKRPGEPDQTWAEISKFRNASKWSPQISLEEGISDILNNIHLWQDAKLWSSEDISNQTQNWFKYLSS